MNKLSETERQAGVQLLSQLKMFNEAVVYFEQHIEPAFWKSFDKCIDRFIKSNNLAGDANYEHKRYCWLAPKNWVIENNNWKYWFETKTTVDEELDYTLAVLAAQGIEQGSFGFEFKLNAAHFGGARKLANYNNSISEKHNEGKEKLIKIGLRDQGKGNYFLPVIIDLKLLCNCWGLNGEFPVEDEVFSPLRDALDTLLEATETLDAMFRDAIETNE
ncbi:hypothetical protein ABN056_09205 [Providencia vermicola]|uniref:Uncharacterized protein n=1 Tax=Providencia stuartii TaxID=588 RepID=A0AAI9HYW4_PROST|nr:MULTISPECIES: hypothetical protein [Providencia]ELR5043268.1 hypothetical protein [Providencia rettgeri]ELR5035179.1 hypothetical protein [Providencia stuartii]ELR5141061.1 hypothetical protein [Providencia stuartii]ELR5290467.1 hypothetical protein [Providencia stuartii]MBG5919019.1 hypothetical protein [Providencia stuartii]